jgi:hypothetical protein
MMATVTDKDLQQLKDLIAAGNAATQKQIADLATATQKQITEMTLEVRASYAQLDKKIDVGLADLKGQINSMDGKIAVCNSKLVGLESTAAKLPDLAEKVGELKNWKQIAIVIFTASVSGSIAWFIRSGQP